MCSVSHGVQFSAFDSKALSRGACLRWLFDTNLYDLMKLGHTLVETLATIFAKDSSMFLLGHHMQKSSHTFIPTQEVRQAAVQAIVTPGS